MLGFAAIYVAFSLVTITFCALNPSAAPLLPFAIGTYTVLLGAVVVAYWCDYRAEEQRRARRYGRRF